METFIADFDKNFWVRQLIIYEKRLTSSRRPEHVRDVEKAENPLIWTPLFLNNNFRLSNRRMIAIV